MLGGFLCGFFFFFCTNNQKSARTRTRWLVFVVATLRSVPICRVIKAAPLIKSLGPARERRRRQMRTEPARSGSSAKQVLLQREEGKKKKSRSAAGDERRRVMLQIFRLRVEKAKRAWL